MQYLMSLLIMKKIGVFVFQNEFDKLPKEGEYRVVIKSTLEDGSLTYGDLVLKGSTKKEILFF